MNNTYSKTNASLHIRNVPLNIAKMRAELHEHRYFLERNIERRTEHLLKRITVLESCNAALCDKLTLAYKEITALRQQSANNDALVSGQATRASSTNRLEQKNAGSMVARQWAEHAVAG